VGHWINERYVTAVSSDGHSSELSADRPTYCEVTSISKHRPLTAIVNEMALWSPGVGRRPLTYALLPWNFVAMDCTQFPEILPFGNFFPGNGKFFPDTGKSSPV